MVGLCQTAFLYPNLTRTNTMNIAVNPTEAEVAECLGQIQDPETGRCLSGTKQIGEVTIGDTGIECRIRLTSHSAILHDEFIANALHKLEESFPAMGPFDVTIEPFDRPPPELGQVGIRVRNLIAVGSGKGGVGKSTIAAALAITLAKSGSRVGLLDADVYGPSLPHLLGLTGHPHIFDGLIQPILFQEIPVMSMGFMVKSDDAIVWRGPMLHGAINQLLRETNWGPLDYLIVDMPPGTGDVALTLSQIVPVSGAVVVCTPQKVALIDAVRAVAMLNNLHIPVVGMVENMSGFVCPHCQERSDVFGSGGARASAEEWQVPFLGEVPMNLQLQQQSDGGCLAQAIEHPICASAFNEIARNLVRNINSRTATSPPRVALPVL